MDGCLYLRVATAHTLPYSDCSAGKPNAAPAGSGDATGAAAAALPAAKRLKTTGQVQQLCSVGKLLELCSRGWGKKLNLIALSNLPAVAQRTGCCLYCTNKQCDVAAGLTLPGGCYCRCRKMHVLPSLSITSPVGIILLSLVRFVLLVVIVSCSWMMLQMAVGWCLNNRILCC